MNPNLLGCSVDVHSRIKHVEFFVRSWIHNFHANTSLLGLGFITSITFIFLVGVFMSSWLGASVLGLGEWFIKRMPLVRHIYNASKQISAAISPGLFCNILLFFVILIWIYCWVRTVKVYIYVVTDQNSQAFKEVAIIRHPRVGEYAFGFITSSVVLQVSYGLLCLAAYKFGKFYYIVA